MEGAISCAPAQGESDGRWAWEARGRTVAIRANRLDSTPSSTRLTTVHCEALACVNGGAATPAHRISCQEAVDEDDCGFAGAVRLGDLGPLFLRDGAHLVFPSGRGVQHDRAATEHANGACRCAWRTGVSSLGAMLRWRPGRGTPSEVARKWAAGGVPRLIESPWKAAEAPRPEGSRMGREGPSALRGAPRGPPGGGEAMICLTPQRPSSLLATGRPSGRREQPSS
jgi:hypothetical protein